MVAPAARARHRHGAALGVLLSATVLAACGTTVPGAGALTSPGTDALGTAPVGTGDTRLNTDVAGPADALVPTGSPTALGGRPATTSAAATTPSSPAARVLSGAAATASTAAIEIGVPYYEVGAANAFLTAYGEQYATGDRVAMTKAVVDEVNAHGGVLGRKLTVVFDQSDANGDRATSQQAACAAFTQDHHVPFVFVYELNDPSYLQCLGKAGVTAIDPTYLRFTRKDLGQFPGLLYPSGISLDTLATVKAEQYAAHGFFQGATTAKIGILYYDLPNFERGEKALEAALKAKGLTVEDRAPIHFPNSASELSQTASDTNSSILRFNTRGVTHVLAVDDGIPETLFASAADEQGYHPKFAWDSGQSVGAIAQSVSARQLAGSQLIGWYPGLDQIDTALMPQTTRDCYALMAKRQQTVNTSNQRLEALRACESVGFLVATLTAAQGRTDRASFLTGAAQLGATYRPVATFRTRLPAGTQDGVGVVRHGTFEAGCSCFRYDSPEMAVR